MKTEKKVIYGWFFFNGRAGKLTNNFFFIWPLMVLLPSAKSVWLDLSMRVGSGIRTIQYMLLEQR